MYSTAPNQLGKLKIGMQVRKGFDILGKAPTSIHLYNACVNSIHLYLVRICLAALELHCVFPYKKNFKESP